MVPVERGCILHFESCLYEQVCDTQRTVPRIRLLPLSRGTAKPNPVALQAFSGLLQRGEVGGEDGGMGLLGARCGGGGGAL